MATLISTPVRVTAAGTKPKVIEEYVGRASSGATDVSIAHMISPSGWQEPGQTPEFDEYTFVVRGVLRVETRDGVLDVVAGQVVHTHPREWVRYSTPDPEGAEYVAICLPAFAPEIVHRDDAS